MTVYALFDRNANDGPAMVPERFSWFAALLPPVFALAHRLWVELAAFVVVAMLLAAVAPSIGHTAAFWIYAAFAIWIGFEAPSFRRTALVARGWRYRRDVVAAGADMAELEGRRGQ